MGQIVTQGIPAELYVVLTKTDGTAATLVAFSSVTCQFRRATDNVFNAKTLTVSNWVELGQGFYKVTFDASELNIPGPFAYLVSGAGLQTFRDTAQVREASSTIPTIPVSLPTCEISGNINDLSNRPIEGVAVAARVLGMPTIMGNVVAVTDDLISEKTDQDGVFVITLPRLATVEITISRVNYRRQLTVPNSPSVNLFTGIP